MSGLVLVACGGEPPPGPDAGPAPAFILDVPAIAVPAATEQVVCFYTTLPAGGPIHRWESEQSPGGHGLQVFALPTALLPDGTVTDTYVYQQAAGAALPRMLYTASLLRDAADQPVDHAM